MFLFFSKLFGFHLVLLSCLITGVVLCPQGQSYHFGVVLLAHLNLTVLTFIQVEMEGLAVEKKKGGGGVFKKGQKKKKRKLDDDDSDQCSVVGDSAFDSGLLGAG